MTVHRPEVERFICHCLGGIVVKKALIVAHERSGHYDALLNSVKGILFLGTPHQGASFGPIVRRLLHGRFRGSELQQVIDGRTTALRDITTQFIERGAKLVVRTFYESEPTKGVMVVDKESARLNWPNECPPCPISADHESICKFSDSRSQKYQPVWKAVEQLVERAREYPFSKKEKDCLLSFAANTGGYSEKLLEQKNKLRIPGTGSWILTHQRYTVWRSGRSNARPEKRNILWLAGGPGTGKTFLC
ncbi:hypothetical protein FN846DRAFT_731060 [Sphaerosporella brunnea]|uniref:Nephrocystin 3-like N-terminal domain-containing protein n=1 Tax=Sphaerosporella brunnea TaxID=1250544 RepID=A0A5J5EW19_9PEZI|nr:hypothetical protein FN846DRAFT_731060 [Sphaerosporella brunnea]